MFDMLLKTATTTKATYYTFGTNTTNNTFDISNFFETAGVALIVLAIIGCLIALACIILIIVSNCKIFKKAGEDWWKAIIPLYNSWVETRIAGLNWYWFALYFVFFALIFSSRSYGFAISWGYTLVSFNYCYGMAKKFGKSNGFAVLMAILPIIGLPILAFGSAKYDKDAKVDPNGIFAIKK